MIMNFFAAVGIVTCVVLYAKLVLDYLKRDEFWIAISPIFVPGAVIIIFAGIMARGA